MALEEVLPDASPQALDLLGQFLLYPPRQRIPASQVGWRPWAAPSAPYCPDSALGSHGSPSQHPLEPIVHGYTQDRGLRPVCLS